MNRNRAYIISIKLKFLKSRLCKVNYHFSDSMMIKKMQLDVSNEPYLSQQ